MLSFLGEALYILAGTTSFLILQSINNNTEINVGQEENCRTTT